MAFFPSLHAPPQSRVMPISKKRKFVADGVFYAELNELLTRTLGPEGYAGVEVHRTQVKTEIVIRLTRAQTILSDNGRRIRELTGLVQSRWTLPEGSVQVFAENVRNRALSAIAQAEAIHFKLSKGIAARRACTGVLKNVMENGATGAEVVISGKLRAARAKAMKFREGYMMKSGDNVNHYVDVAIRHLKLKQGVCGIKVLIMKDHDKTGRNGCAVTPADRVKIEDPKDEEASGAVVPNVVSF